MSFTKVFIPSVANEVGLMAASMLSHIKYWSESTGKEKVYRTNKQLSQDFEGSLSPSQVQRCKQRLIEKGYITTSYDKCYDRVTHYLLTDKAKEVFGMIKAKLKTVANEIKKPVEKVKQAVNKYIKPEQNKTVDTEVKVDGHRPVRGFDLLSALGKKKVAVQEIQEEVQEVNQEEPEPDYDDYFKAIDIAMATAQERVAQHQQNAELEKSTSFTGSTLSIFKRIPNVDILENNRKLKQEADLFSEDY